jgi:hypothetical protein
MNLVGGPFRNSRKCQVLRLHPLNRPSFFVAADELSQPLIVLSLLADIARRMLAMLPF